MGIDDKRDANEESLARRLTLVRGESREASPHRAPKLELIVNPGWKLFEALVANDPRRVSAALGAVLTLTSATGRPAHRSSRRCCRGRTQPSPKSCLSAARTSGCATWPVRHRCTPRRPSGPKRTCASSLAAARRSMPATRPARRRSTSPPVLAGSRRRRSSSSRGADVSIRDHQGRTPLNRVLTHLPEDNQRELLERLLGGFVTAKVVEARSDSLILRVETFHSKYPEAERQAKERGNLTVPCGLLRDVPEPGEIIRCRKGLSQALDEAWRDARRRDLGIEPAR